VPRPFLTAALCLLPGIPSLGAQEATRDPRGPAVLELGTDMCRRGASIGAGGFHGQGATMRERREDPAGPGASAIFRARL